MSEGGALQRQEVLTGGKWPQLHCVRCSGQPGVELGTQQAWQQQEEYQVGRHCSQKPPAGDTHNLDALMNSLLLT